jgi:purine-binding chemotaxis protein CheW
MQQTEQIEQETSLQTSAGTDQYLTFMLAGEEYGLDILNVQEIKGWEGATPIPNTPEHILGVINLRGTVAPIVDLRNCFHLESTDYSPTTVVIMVKAEGGERDRVVGIVVDAVSEVYNVLMGDIEPPPPMGTVVSTEYIKGLATVEDKMIIILNISKMIDSEIEKETYNKIDNNQ